MNFELTFKKQIFGLFTLTSLIAIMLVAISSYQLSYTKIENLTGQKLKSIAATGSLQISSKDHQLILNDLIQGKSQIDKTDHFKRVQKQLRSIKDVNGLKQDIYTVVIPDGVEDMMVFISMSNEKAYIGNAMKLHPLVKKSIESKLPHFTGIYEDHEGQWVSGFAPVIDSNGNAIAVLEVDYDVHDEIALIKSELKRSLMAPIFLVISFVIGLALYFSKSVTNPLEKLLHKVELLSNDNYDVKTVNKSKITEFNNLNDSFDQMALTIFESKKKIEDYAQNLELKVEQRTLELKKSKDDIENILNNLSQGFLTFDPLGDVGQDYSKVAETMFATNPTGKSFNDLINKFSEYSIEDFEDWKGLAFSGAVEFSSLTDLLPERFENNLQQQIFLNYRPIFNERGDLTKVICIAEDRTKEIEFQKEIVNKEAYASFILHITKCPEIFKDYCESVTSKVEKTLEILNRDQKLLASSLEVVARFIHTIKGESGFNHVVELVEKSNQVEDILSDINQNLTEVQKDPKPFHKVLENSVLEIKDTFQQFLLTNRDILNDDINQLENVTRNKQDIIHYLNNLENSDQDINELVDDFKSFFLMEDASLAFKKYDGLVKDLSKKQGKEVELNIKNEGVRVNIDKYQELLSSCVHIFRNAIDHGIETPDERIENGKNSKATIDVNINYKIDKSNGKYIQIQLKDDGKGIDYKKLAFKAIQSGIIDGKKLEQFSIEELRQLIFHPGLSSKDEVTDVSGRGVGLDAVKAEIEKVGGTIVVDSTPGKGTSFYIDLPIM